MEDKKDKAILIMALIPVHQACECGHINTLNKEAFSSFFIVTAADCPACGQPIAVSPGQPTAGAGDTIH